MTDKTKTLIKIGLGLLALGSIVFFIYQHFTSPGYYLGREIHRQREKQEALDLLKESESKIQYYRSKRNAVQYNGIDYLGKAQGEQSPQLEMNQDQSDN